MIILAFTATTMNTSTAQSTAHERKGPDGHGYGEPIAGTVPDFSSTDPELATVLENFITGEVVPHGGLEERDRLMAILASAIACQSISQYRISLNEALDAGITPVEAKEIVYQSVPYVGISKARDFIRATNEIFTGRGIPLPLEGRSTTSPETRFERGLAVQKEIFGERIENNYRNSPAGQLHIQRYLSANCFGDFVARGGLDLKTREMLTFSMLLSLGGCEPQLKGHIEGNVNVGNGKDYLLAVVTQLIPYVGYPRALNAIACLNETIPE